MRTPLLKNLIVGVVVMGGIAALIHNMGREYQASHPPQTDLSRLTLAQALAHCRALWTAFHYDQAPLALAWHPHGVDWYVLEGEDTESMRHYACRDSGVERGGRFRRPAQDSDAPPAHNLFDQAASMPEAGLLAYEAMVQTTGAVAQRLWTGAGNAQVQPPDAPAFPVLFARSPAALPAGSQLLLIPLEKKNWIRDPQGLFSLLAEHVQPSMRVVRLDFSESSAHITVLGPVARSEGDPPAPFGTARFDEYGVRSTTSWSPAEATPGLCLSGASLSEVAALFWRHREAANPALLGASFGCADKGTGDPGWKLRLPNRRAPT